MFETLKQFYKNSGRKLRAAKDGIDAFRDKIDDFADRIDERLNGPNPWRLFTESDIPIEEKLAKVDRLIAEYKSRINERESRSYTPQPLHLLLI